MTDESTKPTQPTKADQPAQPDVPPDRMSIVPNSKYFDQDLLQRGIGIRFKGKERTNVQEYCISEGWVKMVAGKSVDRFGRPITIKSTGTVEAWFEDLIEDAQEDSEEDSPEESEEDSPEESDGPEAETSETASE